MTDADADSLVTLELGRARTSLSAAELLAHASKLEDAVSRAYYDAGCALVASIGRSARTHDGLRALIGEHFIRTGVLDPRHGRELARLAGERGDADYNVAAVFTREDVDGDIAAARAFVDAVADLLGK